MFLKFKRFRMSANAVTFMRPNFKPLLIRRSRYLTHGVEAELMSPAWADDSPKFVPGAVLPFPPLTSGV